MSFKVPEDYQFFYDEVIEKCKTLIHLNYWDDIDIATLNDWLKNFKSPEEKYLSALILHKLVYRNKKAIYSMLSKLFHVTLPNILEENNIFSITTNMETWKASLKNKSFKNKATFYFSTIISNEPGESGGEYMRFLRKHFVDKELIVFATHKAEKSKKALIFIDDIIATGTQVSEFLEKYRQQLTHYKYLIFLPLIAHTEGIKEVEQEASQRGLKTLIIRPVEILNEESSFFHFSTNEDGQFDNVNTINDLRTFYNAIISKYYLEDDASKYAGFGNFGLTLIFGTGVPDNTLPIIHQRGKKSAWVPLYEKF